MPNYRRRPHPHTLARRRTGLPMARSSPTTTAIACQEVRAHTPSRILQEEAKRLDAAPVPVEERMQAIRSISPVISCILEQPAAATFGKAAKAHRSTPLLQTRPRPARSRTTRLRTATTAATTAATRVQSAMHQPLLVLVPVAVRATRKFTTIIIPARARRAHPTGTTRITRTTSSARPCSRAPLPSLLTSREARAT